MSRAVVELDATSCPPTHNAPTGAGDYDIVCDGCGEIVVDPHSWAECAKGLRERLRGALDAIASADHARDVAVEEEREACAKIAQDIFVGNTEIPRKDAAAWIACAAFILDEIRGRGFATATAANANELQEALNSLNDGVVADDTGNLCRLDGRVIATADDPSQVVWLKRIAAIVNAAVEARGES